MPTQKKSLILLGDPPQPDFLSEIRDGRAPRLEHLELAEALNAEVMSFDDVTRLPGAFKPLVDRDHLLGSSLVALLRRSEFETIYVTGEDIGLRLAPLLRLSGWRGRLFTVVHACTSERRKSFFRILGSKGFPKLITVCGAQRDILVNEVGFPPENVLFRPNWVDTKFYVPEDGFGAAERDYIFSCGRENRDYASLFSAAAQLPYAFKAAASGFRHAGGDLAASAPPNVTLFDRKVSFEELRASYAGARFVVVPLHAVPYAAGVTGVVEAMAMGKAVIATASPGIAEYIQDGVTGRVVPPNDPGALAAAITDMWNSPDRCDVIGRRNRTWAEANASIEGYVQAIATAMAPGRERTNPPAHAVAEALDLQRS